MQERIVELILDNDAFEVIHNGVSKVILYEGFVSAENYLVNTLERR